MNVSVCRASQVYLGVGIPAGLLAGVLLMCFICHRAFGPKSSSVNASPTPPQSEMGRAPLAVAQGMNVATGMPAGVPVVQAVAVPMQ